MKKAAIVLLLVLILSLLPCGCDGAKFVINGTGNKQTILVNDAEDGAFARSASFSVGKEKSAAIESALDRGELKIDFTEVTIVRHGDASKEVVMGEVIASATVGAGDRSEVSLPQGDYVLQIAAVGSTNGKVTVLFS